MLQKCRRPTRSYLGVWGITTKLYVFTSIDSRITLLQSRECLLIVQIHRRAFFLCYLSYCAKLYTSAPDPHGIFLVLLRVYLRPSSSESVLLGPALALIAKHCVRLDATEVLALLPPLITMEDIRSFLIRTLRDGFAKRNEQKVVKSLISARKEEVEKILMGFQEKRVRVTDQRMLV